MKVLIAAGGTGGHIYPGISIGEKLREKKVEPIFLGTKDGMESSIVPRYGFRLITVSTGQFVGKDLHAKMRTGFRVIKGILQCLEIMRREKFACVVGMGSFVSFPAIVSAYLKGIPFFLHEQNFTLGLANRLFYRFAKKIFLSFEETAKIYGIKNYSYTGNPVRREIKDAPDSERKEGFGIFIFGGSRGAKSLNRATLELLPLLEGIKDLKVYHQTGNEDYEYVRAAYKSSSVSGEVFPFTEDMGRYYGLSDLVISRAGSSTIFELACRRKPAILVPYPFSAQNHQWKNALFVQRIGGAFVIGDDELSGKKIYEIVVGLKNDREKLRVMGEKIGTLYVENSEEKIVNEILEELG